MSGTNIVFFNNLNWSKNEIIEQHSHNCYEIVYYEKALGTTNFNGKILEFSTNNFCLIPRNLPHSEKHLINGNTIFIGFNDETLNLKEPLMLADTEDLRIKKIINLIIKEALNQEENYFEMISLMLKQLLLTIKRIPNKEQPVKKSRDLSLVIAYIAENYSFKITIKQLLNIACYSDGHLRRLFKQQYGMSPQNYIINFRLQKAVELLKDENLSCTKVAYMCGIPDSAQFSKLFRNKYGISPKKYQLQMKENQ